MHSGALKRYIAQNEYQLKTYTNYRNCVGGFEVDKKEFFTINCDMHLSNMPNFESFIRI